MSVSGICDTIAGPRLAHLSTSHWRRSRTRPCMSLRDRRDGSSVGIILRDGVGDLARRADRGPALPLDTPKRYLAAFLGHFGCPWSSAGQLESQVVGVQRGTSNQVGRYLWLPAVQLAGRRWWMVDGGWSKAPGSAPMFCRPEAQVGTSIAPSIFRGAGVGPVSAGCRGQSSSNQTVSTSSKKIGFLMMQRSTKLQLTS